MTKSKVDDRVIALALSLGALILYVLTLAPGVLDGDSGEWQYMIPLVGVAHSTGYPLYIFLAKFFVSLVPFGSISYRANLFSAVCAALAVGIFFLLASRLTTRLFPNFTLARNARHGDWLLSRFPSVFAAVVLAIAPTLWASAVQAEVYALNTCLGLIAFYLGWEWYEFRNPRIFLLLSLVLGLALDNHRVIAFLSPGLLVLLWFTRDSLNLKRLAFATALVLLPLSLYAYIPLRAGQLISQQDPANWELYKREDAILKGTVSAYYRPTLDGFVNLVLAFDNRNKLGFQTDNPDATFTARSQRALGLALDQFTIVGLVFALAGSIIWVRREWKRALVFLTMGAGIALIGFTLRGESTQFYFSLAYVIAGLCIAIALMWAYMLALISSREGNKTPFLLLVLLYVFLSMGFLFMLVRNSLLLDNSHNARYRDYAQTVLNDGLAAGSVIIGGWEIVTPIRYYQFIEGQRPDLLVIHESPVRPQYQKIFDAARAQHRPFYYIQFSPEDQNAPGSRYVQAIALPLHGTTQPQSMVQGKIARDVTLVGYSFLPTPRPGQMSRVELFYHVDADIHEEFDSEFSIVDASGREWGHYSHPPVTEYYRTYFWKAGESYRDVWYWQVPADAPSNEFQAELSWYNLNQNHAETKVDFTFSIDNSSK